MARIAGINIPSDKRIEIALTYIYGIGRSLSGKILSQANVDPDVKTSALTEEEINRLREVIEKNYKVEGDLKRELSLNIRRLKDISSYRGDRHKKNLPVRGQRTKTNARTKRGKRMTVGTGRRKAPEKT
jgi:small subunit ribosomal protein S13